MKKRLAMIEQQASPILSMAEIIRQARERIRRGVERTERLPTLVELENIIATSKSPMSVKLAEANIRVRNYTE
jgi:hypothetical protein